MKTSVVLKAAVGATGHAARQLELEFQSHSPDIPIKVSPTVFVPFLQRQPAVVFGNESFFAVCSGELSERLESDLMAGLLFLQLWYLARLLQRNRRK